MLPYRRDLDGLRGVAVLAVTLYHAELTIFSAKIFKGGFLGVDIFFVISGYLISHKIMEKSDQTFSLALKQFYLGRIKRILPALFFAILTTLIIAFFILHGSGFVDLAKSSFAGIFMYANFYWGSTSFSYGEALNSFRPLFHLWSLSVEEQFYFFFPVILIFLLKKSKSRAITILSLAMLASVVYAQLYSTQSSTDSYFMLLGRVWEFLIGGLLALSCDFKMAKKQTVVPFISLITLLIFFQSFDLTLQHPGFITVLPIMACCLIIYFNNNKLIQAVLGFKPLVHIGKISYSLYLWHFIIFAFMRLTFRFSTLPEKMFALLLSYVISLFSYHLVEQKFRYLLDLKKTKKFLWVVGLLSCSFSTLVIVKKGYLSSVSIPENLGEEFLLAERSAFWKEHIRIEPEHMKFSPHKFSINIIGNSWGYDIYYGLKNNSDFEVFFSDFLPAKCRLLTIPTIEDMEKVCRVDNREHFKKIPLHTNLVIVAFNDWFDLNEFELVVSENLKNISLIRESGYRGPILTIFTRPLLLKTPTHIISEIGLINDQINNHTESYLRASPAEMRKVNAKYKAIFEQHNIYFYSLVDSLCDNKNCKLIQNGESLYYDRNHLSRIGADYISKDLIQFIQALPK